MSGVLVCIPADRNDPQSLFAGPVAAITANQALCETFDYDAEAGEEAEYAALVLASVWSLTRHGERFVVTAEVDPSQIVVGEEADNGGVTLTGLRRAQLVAWFDDQPDDQINGIVEAAASAVQGQGIDEAWDHEEVTALLQHELLWHAIEEWGI